MNLLLAVLTLTTIVLEPRHRPVDFTLQDDDTYIAKNNTDEKVWMVYDCGDQWETKSVLMEPHSTQRLVFKTPEGRKELCFLSNWSYWYAPTP